MIRSFAKYISAGIITQATLLIFWILAAKFLKPELLGNAYEYILFIDITVVFSMFGADAVIYKYYYSNSSKEKVFNSSLKIALIGYLFIFIVFIILYILNFLKFDLLLLFLFLIHVFFNILSNLIYSHLIAIKDSSSYIKLNIYKSVYLLVFSIGLFFFFKNIYFFSFIYLSSFAILFFVNRKKISIIKSIIKSNENIQVNSYLKYSLPFMFYSLTGMVYSYSSRYIVNSLLDVKSFAIFGLFYTFYALVEGLVSNLNKTWTPFIYSKLQNEFEVVNNIIFYVIIFLISSYSLIFFGITLFEKTFFLNLIIGSHYTNQILILYIILLSPFFIFIYSALSPVITFNKNSKKYFISNLIKALFSIIISFYLIKSYKLIGAAFSVVIASLMNLLVFSIFYFRNFKISKLFFAYFIYTLTVLLIFTYLLLYHKNIHFAWNFSILLNILPAIIVLFKFKKLKSLLS